MLTLAAVFAAIGVLGRNPMLPPRSLTHIRARHLVSARVRCPALPFGGGPAAPPPPGAILVGRAGDTIVYRLKNGGYRTFHRATMPGGSRLYGGRSQ